MNENLSDDELVSAILDGEADDADRARLEADPALQQRLASFRQVSQQVASATAPPSVDGRESAIAAALAAAPVEVSNVTSITAARRRPWLVAAAAVAAVAVLAPLGFLALEDLGDGTGTDTEIASGSEDPEEAGVTPLSTTPSTTGSGGPTEPGPGLGPDGGPSNGMAAHLGDLPDDRAVASAVANYTATSTTQPSGPSPTPQPTTPPTSSGPPATDPPATSSTVDPTSNPAPSEPGTGTPVGELPCLDVAARWQPVELVAEATYQGIEAVIVVRGTDPDRTAMVLDRSTCELIAEVPIET